MGNLEKAIKIAAKAHFDQIDKAGQPYILHPLRLMFKFQDEAERIVAVLHDVIEDSDITKDDLRRLGFSEEVVESIDCLSKKEGEDYYDFIYRISKNNLAKKVKIEDIKDNLDITRLNEVTEKDLQRLKKYHRALKILTGK